jgi:hypothetical protein
VSREADLELLRRYEPVLKFTAGEQFYPIDAERYVRTASLWEQRPGEEPVCLLEGEELTLERLGAVGGARPDAVQFLKFTDPLDASELAAYYLKSSSDDGMRSEFRAGTGRLARVGYLSRFVDAMFNLSLLARGRVPGDAATAATLAYRDLRSEQRAYGYHGRVVHEAGWVVLQYWYFYVFNNWRSGFYGANDHEADWELVSIYLAETPAAHGPNRQNGAGRAEQEEERLPANLTPQWLAYAVHDYQGDDLRRRWDDPELERIGEHPVVYVAAGSHACYYRQGEYLTEIELPFLAPLVRVADRIQAFWHNQLHQYRGEGENGRSDERTNIFRIPFVDYARGDGLVIGPGQEAEWDERRWIDPEASWILAYRGLWGLYTRDPLAGEDAPAGPMYNRDRSIRRAWYDPVGWAGLDKVPPPADRVAIVLEQQMELRRRQAELAVQIEQKGRELRGLAMATQAMRMQPHLQKLGRAYQGRIAKLSQELNALRAQAASEQALLIALDNYGWQVSEGYAGPARAHIRRAHAPTHEEQYRAVRLAEFWAAVSIGLMLVAFVALIYFARHYATIGLAVMIALYTFVEASFRGRVVRLVTSVTIGLAVAAALVLVYEFFWQIAAIAVVLTGSYILWDNLSELWR